MSKLEENNRLEFIRKRLKRGDKKRIAELHGCSRVWVSYVVGGVGVSEPLIRLIETYLAEKESQTNKTI